MGNKMKNLRAVVRGSYEIGKSRGAEAYVNARKAGRRIQLRNQMREINSRYTDDEVVANTIFPPEASFPNQFSDEDLAAYATAYKEYKEL